MAINEDPTPAPAVVVAEAESPAPAAGRATPPTSPPEGLAALGRELGYYSGPQVDEETGETASADSVKEGAFTETWGKRLEKASTMT